MNTTVADIQLTVEQEKAIINLADKLREPVFGKLKLSSNPDEQPKPHLIEWVMYLLQVAIEGASVRTKKKSRTTAKRRTHLRKIEKILGQYPTDNAIHELFGQEASKQLDLISLLQLDVRQLHDYKPVKKSELEKIHKRIQKLQKRIKK